MKIPRWLTAILVLAALLRLWKLDQVPISLFGDEVDVGYHAYSILRTGRDYMGQFLPFYIHSLSEWRSPLFLYSTIPTIAIFGLNEWGVRLSSAIFGILGVYLLYFFGRRLYGERVGLVAAVFLAILPWHIHYSRAAFEVTLLLVLLLSGTLLFLGVKTRLRIIVSAILFALTPYTYSTAVVFTPLYMLLLGFLSRERGKNLAIFFVTAGVVVIPFINITFFGPASGRFSLLSVFKSERIIDEINIERTETGMVAERFFHNKLVGWGETIASNYVRSFSPDFLFVRGDPNPRHAVPGTGVFYWAFVPLLLLGGSRLLSNLKKEHVLVLGWLLLAPIPAALTVDGANHATRLFLMIPPFVLLSALGFDKLLGLKARTGKLAFMGIVILLVLNTIFYYHRYLTHYNFQYWRYWHLGYKEMMQTVANNQDSYDLVFINNTYEPSLLHYLFWTKYDPAEFQRNFRGDVPNVDTYPGFNGFKLGDKLYFGQADSLVAFLQPKMLYLAVQGREIPGDWDWQKSPPRDIKALNFMRNPQGQPLFTLVTRE